MEFFNIIFLISILGLIPLQWTYNAIRWLRKNIEYNKNIVNLLWLIGYWITLIIVAIETFWEKWPESAAWWLLILYIWYSLFLYFPLYFIASWKDKKTNNTES